MQKNSETIDLSGEERKMGDIVRIACHCLNVTLGKQKSLFFIFSLLEKENTDFLNSCGVYI